MNINMFFRALLWYIAIPAVFLCAIIGGVLYLASLMGTGYDFAFVFILMMLCFIVHTRIDRSKEDGSKKSFFQNLFQFVDRQVGS